MNLKDFKNFINEYLNEFPEDFNKINDESSESFETIEDFSSNLCLFSEVLDKNYFNQDVVKSFKKAIKSKEYDEAYFILLNEYLYAHIGLTITLKNDPKRFSRHFLFPIRITLDKLMIAILSSFRLIDTNKYSLLIGDELFKIDDLINDAKKCIVQNLIFDKCPKLIYNNEYIFNIRLRRHRYIDNLCVPWVIEKSKGGFLPNNYNDLLKVLFDNEALDDNGNLIRNIDGDDIFETSTDKVYKYTIITYEFLNILLNNLSDLPDFDTEEVS